MSTDKRTERMLDKLKNKKHREAFVNQTINVGIPFQVKALRERRQLTQQDIEEISGIKQTQICRYEDPNYSSFSLNTLKKIAAAYDVSLIVRFAPFSESVKYELGFDSESLKVLSYEDDPYFKTPAKEVDIALPDTFGTTICPSDIPNKVVPINIKRLQAEKTTSVTLEKEMLLSVAAQG